MINLSEVQEFDENTIYLPDGIHLNEYKDNKFDFSKGLPNGIFDKRYTGIGATWTEFTSPRKSIIVFPFRRLAEEKAKIHKDCPTLYVGTGKNNKKQKQVEIENWIKKNKTKNIKFSVVADSIEKLINALKKVGEDPYKDYFLVLDEVELLQMQSGFRKVLPLCFDYFKKFDKKCLVSATLLGFTDNKLKKLELFKVELYDKILTLTSEEEPVEEDLRLFRFNTPFPHIMVARKIADFFNRKDIFPLDYKFFIGINSLDAIKEFIDEFERHDKTTGISVLVSESSKDKFFSKYNQKNIEAGILPSHINLTTCINWSGIDLKEPFFSVAISLPDKVHHSFSYENIIQFFGRCRLDQSNQLIKTLVISDCPNLDFKPSDVSASDRIKHLKGLLNYISIEIKSKKDKSEIKKALCETPIPYFYKSIGGKIKINWLLEDLEKYVNNIVKDYDDFGSGLLKKLNARFQILEIATEDASFVDVQKKSYEDKLTEELETLLDNLSEDYSRNKLVRYIQESKSSAIRVAAYWYLFGREFELDHEDCKVLAEKFSSEKYPLLTTQITVLGLRFYTRYNDIYQNFVRMLYGQRNNQRNITSKKIIEVIESELVFTKHFTFLLESGNKEARASILAQYFFGLEKSQGSNPKFKIIDGVLESPDLLKSYPDILEILERVARRPISEGIRYNSHNPVNLIDETFYKKS